MSDHLVQSTGVVKCWECGRRQHAPIVRIDADGELFRCKSCGHEFRKLTFAEAQRRERERRRRWAAEHPEKVREYQRRYRADHREEINAAARKRVARHREQYNAHKRELYAANVERERARRRAYYHEHRQEINDRKAYARLYSDPAKEAR